MGDDGRAPAPVRHSVLTPSGRISYLEQGDYKRAQDFLNDAYKTQTTTKPGAADAYFAIASQIADPAFRTRFLEDVPENARTLVLARAWLGEPAPEA